ncbi:hypothetical protein DFH06DRAFT_1084872 [Mycena polygramma]|nr:hypothetical protein DFH06DRAFT_1084872 [Mycena polygramma]
MKCGFLKSSKAKARPLGPIPDEKTFIPVSRSSAWAMIGEPNSLREELDPARYEEDDPRGGTSGEDLVYTTVPFDAEPDEPVSECLFYPGSKEVLMNLAGFPQPLKHPATPAFCVNVAPGKGLGLFSTRPLKAGELILSERPLFVAAPSAVMAFDLSSLMLSAAERDQILTDEMEKLYQVSVDRMRPDDRAAYMALADTGKYRSTPVYSISATNAFSLHGLRPGVTPSRDTYTATCKYISRLNHSCSPNTGKRFDMLSFSYQLFAARDLPEGEELTLQYTYLDCSAAERRANLRTFAFICSCASCTDSVASDPRRAAILAFRPSVIAWVRDRTLPDDWLLVKCRDALALLVLEGLENIPQYSDATKTMMEVHICLGDAQSASEWAAKLDMHRWQEVQPDVKALLDPASPAYPKHPLWRRRFGSI